MSVMLQVKIRNHTHFVILEGKSVINSEIIKYVHSTNISRKRDVNVQNYETVQSFVFSLFWLLISSILNFKHPNRSPFVFFPSLSIVHSGRRGRDFGKRRELGRVDHPDRWVDGSVQGRKSVFWGGNKGACRWVPCSRAPQPCLEVDLFFTTRFIVLRIRIDL